MAAPRTHSHKVLKTLHSLPTPLTRAPEKSPPCPEFTLSLELSHCRCLIFSALKVLKGWKELNLIKPARSPRGVDMQRKTLSFPFSVLLDRMASILPPAVNEAKSV